MSTDTIVNNLIINTLTKAQFEAIAEPSETELYFVEEIEDDGTYAKDSEVVHNTGEENIYGIKTFVDGAIINNGQATTVDITDNSYNIATTAFVHNFFASVQETITSLQENVTTLQETINSLQAEITDLQERVEELEENSSSQQEGIIGNLGDILG